MPHRRIEKCSISTPWYINQLQLWPGPDLDTRRGLLESIHSIVRSIERERGCRREFRPIPIWIWWTKESQFNLLHELSDITAIQRSFVPILAVGSQWWKGVRLARRCSRQASRQQLTSLVDKAILILTNDWSTRLQPCRILLCIQRLRWEPNKCKSATRCLRVPQFGIWSSWNSLEGHSTEVYLSECIPGPVDLSNCL